MTTINYGFKPSHNDPRDFIYSQIVYGAPDLPERHMLPNIPIRDQGRYGTCVGHASQAIRDVVERGFDGSFRGSPLFAYAECKKRDGIPEQEGTYPRVAMSVLKNLGIAREETVPYSLMYDKIDLPEIPSKAYDEAEAYRIGAYARVQTVNEIKQAIHTGVPVMAGIILADNFVKPENGFVGLPEGSLLGGHAIALDGWDDNMTHTFADGTTLTGFFRFINSWGTEWGDNGYGYLPYDYVEYSTDIGMKFFAEAWSSVDDVFIPTDKTDKIVLKIGDKNAKVNGKDVVLDQAPVIEPSTNRTLVPIRFIAENLGFNVNYDNHTKEITISKKGGE